jgi:excinuclease UvrABC nuclease subunit
MKQVAESRGGYEAGQPIPKEEIAKLIKDLERQMKESAKSMEFERAALLRDQIYELRATMADANDPNGDGKVDGNGSASGAVGVLAAQAAAAREQRAARSPTRYGGGRRRR